MKRMASIILALIMALSLLPTAVWAEAGEAGGGDTAAKPVEVWTAFNGKKVAEYGDLETAAASLGENKWLVIGADYTLNENFTIPENVYLDVATGATLTVAEGVTLTVAADASRLGVRSGATVVNNGTIMVCGKSFKSGKVSLLKTDGKTLGELKGNALSVPDGCFLDNNSTNFYATAAAEAVYEITFADGSVKLTKDSTNISGGNVTQIKLLKDDNKGGFALANYAESVGPEVTFDLNGHTISYSGTNYAYATLNIYTKVTIKNGTVKYTGTSRGAIDMGSNGNLTVAADAIIDGGASYGIFTSGTSKLTVYGTVKANGGYAIAGNGSKDNGGNIDNCDITVNDGAVISAPNGIGIYHPELGTVTVNGGSISGHTGVQMCAGKLAVNGGKITSTGANEDRTGSQNAMPDGAAVSIVSRNYPGGTPKAEIKGGTFIATGSDAQALRAYDYTQNEVKAWTDVKAHVSVTGGVYSTDPEAYVAEGYLVENTEDGRFVVTTPAFEVNGTKYDTLGGAVAAIGKSGTVKLLRDVMGGGVRVDGKDITIDLNGFTYTVSSPTVGSQGTETNGFQFLKGSKVTIQGGKMRVDKGLRCAYLFQNYADLTLKDVDVDISMCKPCEAAVHSMNGVVNIIGTTSINGTGDYEWNSADKGPRKAIMVNDWNNGVYVDGTQVTVNTTGTISGTVLAGYYEAKGKTQTTGKSELNLVNGTFEGSLVQEAAKGDFAATAVTVTGGTYTVDPSAYVDADKYAVYEKDGRFHVAAWEKQNAPTGLTAVDETVKGKADGAIRGVTDAMEYSADGKSYKAISGTELTGLASGTYYVRYKAADNKITGEAVKLTVKAGRMLTVRFNTLGGSSMSDVSASYGEAISAATPTREGFTFDGWYTDAGCTARWNASAGVTADTNLYAKWQAIPGKGVDSANTEVKDNGDGTITETTTEITGDDENGTVTKVDNVIDIATGESKGATATTTDTTTKTEDGVTTVTTVEATVSVDENGKTTDKTTKVTETTTENGRTVGSTVEVKDGLDVNVDGLHDAAQAVADKTEADVSLKLTVKETKENTDIAKKTAKDGETTYVEITLKDETNGKTLTETDRVLAIRVDGVDTGKKYISVYRQHGAEVSAFERVETMPEVMKDGTFYVGDGYVVIFTSRFSDYAISVSDEAPAGTDTPATGDMGVAIYGVTALLSLTGMAWTSKKRRK